MVPDVATWCQLRSQLWAHSLVSKRSSDVQSHVLNNIQSAVSWFKMGPPMTRGRRESPLVSQFLERISGETLAKHQKVIRELVQRRSGVYALYRRDRLYYVGLASNLRNRLK